MPGLKRYESNRMEILADRLAELLAVPLAQPLAPEIILVQSRGMERWLSLALARRHGICSNVRFPYPTHFVHTLFRECSPKLPERSPYEPAIMAWDIIDVLPSMLNLSEFKVLQTYLGDGENDLKRFQLAQRIADLFDQYLLFRPEMVLKWDEGHDGHWQAALWREMVKRKGSLHRAALQRDFFTIMRDSFVRFRTVPERISVFGISALPPFYVQILAAVSKVIEVNLFLMNPCREFWGDIVSEKEVSRIAGKQAAWNRDPEKLYLEQGNRLLASMGALGRDFFQMIADLPCEEVVSFADPGEATLLAAIQSDILNLIERSPEDESGLSGADGSLQLHVCHSPLREVEALHDALLATFAGDPHLRPDDVLVMIPDIAPYAPFIQAVFPLPPEDPRWVPFTIADRGFLSESSIIDTYLRLLDLNQSRFGAAQVLDLLEAPAVRQKFSLAGDDLELIRHWVRQTGICWGIDAQSKETLDLPPDPGNTWRAGFDRLLLGYALPAGTEDVLIDGIYPFDDIEGGSAAVFGRFLVFMEALFAFTKALNEKRTLAGWAEMLLKILETFFADDEKHVPEIQAIRRVLQDLPDLQVASGYGGKIGLDVIKACLKQTLTEKGSGAGFLAGGVTFCTILPMRSIPFKVVALLGMNDEAYPRQSIPLGFDLMADSPRLGDRSRRKDDRYLFLEALLSARQRLYISYCGQSLKDNSPRPPSVLVSELLDYVEEAFGAMVRERICTHHRLQAFHPAYFTGQERLYSYSKENLAAAQSAAAPRRESAAFITAGLSEPDAEWNQIDIAAFCAFFAHPARFLLNRRLGLYLREDEGALEENEPFALDKLSEYAVKQDLITRLLGGRDSAQAYPVLKASGKLPHGAPGKSVYDDLAAATTNFTGKINPFVAGGRMEAIDVDTVIDGFRLTGRLENVYPQGLVSYRLATVKARDRLGAWIRHLVFNHVGAGATDRQTVVIGEDKAFRYPPLADASQHLAVLFALYGQGLRRPLHFFPESSALYAAATLKGKDAAEALRSAQGKWDAFTFPERDDPYYRLCFGRSDPLDDEFRRLAEAIFHPLLENEEAIR